MEMIILLYKIVICHFIGDYVLQTDFLASTKGTNRYHMLVHVALYTVPFAFIFGCDVLLAINFVAHFAIDEMKARYNLIPYWVDQTLHFAWLFLIYVVLRGTYV